MSRPRLLLLDEPSMGLAPVLVEQILHAVVAL
jgi:branched-chain amino acid transport system ATP-binding protein